MAVRTTHVLVLLASVCATPAFAEQRKPRTPSVTIYVGPLVRDGIVEIDAGIADTIGDIKGRLKFRKKALTVVQERTQAKLALIVMDRYTGRDRGAVAAPMGAGAIAISLEAKVVEAVLHFGDYQKRLTCEHMEWRDCAGSLVNDVRTWLEANQALVSGQ